MTDVTTDTTEAAVEAALAELTLEEKVHLLTGRDFWSTTPIERIGLRTHRRLRRTVRGPRGGLGRAVALAQPAVRVGAVGLVRHRHRPPLRRRRRGRGPPQGRRRRARPDHQPAPLAARRAPLRGLQRGPGAHRRPRRRVRHRPAATTASARPPSTTSRTTPRPTGSRSTSRSTPRALHELYLLRLRAGHRRVPRLGRHELLQLGPRRDRHRARPARDPAEDRLGLRRRRHQRLDGRTQPRARPRRSRTSSCPGRTVRGAPRSSRR